jgi:hypothetical protein
VRAGLLDAEFGRHPASPPSVDRGRRRASRALLLSSSARRARVNSRRGPLPCATGVPAGVPHGVAHAARDNLGAAAAAVQPLPASLADPLLTAARAAFTSGFQMAAIVSAALMVLIAVLVLRLGRAARHVES